jgi:hypothetical protein
MAAVKFFVEGDADKKFLLDYLKHLKIEGISNSDFVTVNSNTESALEKVKPDFVRSTAKGNTNLLIFDADANYSNTLSELKRISAIQQISFIPFLFPNDSSDGNLETLLENVINPNNKPIFDCFENYQTCLIGKSTNYNVPAKKTKIYAYVSVLVSEKDSDQAKENKRDYLNSAHWDLNSSYLDPLKAFLQTNVK